MVTGESTNTAAENAKLARKAEEKAEMVTWVSGLAPWELAFTGTWKWEASAESARRCFERWMKREAPDVSYFYALERNPCRDGFHVHSLWANTAGLYRRAMWDRWFQRFGRNKLEPIKCRVSAEEYLTKYCTKEVTWEERGWWNVHLVDPMLPDLAEKPGKGPKRKGVVTPIGVTPDQAETFCSRLERELTMEARSQ